MIAAASAPRLSRVHLALVTTTVIVSYWMGTIDSTVTNLGFGTIAGGLNVSIDEVAWISTAYVIAMVTSLPLSGWLAANVGRKPAFIGSLAVFTAASFACAISQNLVELSTARFVQGLAAGAMQPLAGAALMDAYPRPQLPQAFKIIGLGGMIGPLIGPLIGGVILERFPWPAIFLINVPVGLLTIALASAVLREQSQSLEKSAFDWNALALMGIGLFAFQYVVQQGPHDEWFASSRVVAATLLAAGALAAFVHAQLRSPRPLVDLAPLRLPSFSAGLVLAVVTGVCITGTAFIVPLYFQQVLGFDAQTAALGIVPSALATIAAIQSSAWLGKRLTQVGVVLLGLAIYAAGTLWFCFLGKDIGFDEIVVPRIVQGFGNGLLFLPLNIIIMARIPPRWYDAATGLSGVARQLGVSMGYALLSGVLVRAQTAAAGAFFARVHLGAVTTAHGLGPIRAWLVAHGHSSADASAYTTSVFAQLVARNASLAGYQYTFFLIGMLMLLTMPVVVLIRRSAAVESEPT